jgi:hypothetical protein
VHVRGLDASTRSRATAAATDALFWRELLAPFDNDWEDGPWFRDYVAFALTPTTERPQARPVDVRAVAAHHPDRVHQRTPLTTSPAPAADALEEWANSEARAFDVQSQGTSYMRSQKVKGLRDQALELRRRQRVGLGRLVRSDEC